MREHAKEKSSLIESEIFQRVNFVFLRLSRSGTCLYRVRTSFLEAGVVTGNCIVSKISPGAKWVILIHAYNLAKNMQ